MVIRVLDTYWWRIRIICWEEAIKYKETIMVWSAIRSYYDGPQEFHSCFVNPYKYCFCRNKRQQLTYHKHERKSEKGRDL